MKSHSIAIVVFSTIILAACHRDNAQEHPVSTQYASISCWAGDVHGPMDLRIYYGDTEAGQPITIDSSGVDFREAKTEQHKHVYGGACLVEYHDH